MTDLTSTQRTRLGNGLLQIDRRLDGVLTTLHRAARQSPFSTEEADATAVQHVIAGDYVRQARVVLAEIAARHHAPIPRATGSADAHSPRSR